MSRFMTYEQSRTRARQLYDAVASNSIEGELADRLYNAVGVWVDERLPELAAALLTYPTDRVATGLLRASLSEAVAEAVEETLRQERYNEYDRALADGADFLAGLRCST